MEKKLRSNYSGRSNPAYRRGVDDRSGSILEKFIVDSSSRRRQRRKTNGAARAALWLLDEVSRFQLRPVAMLTSQASSAQRDVGALKKRFPERMLATARRTICKQKLDSTSNTQPGCSGLPLSFFTARADVINIIPRSISSLEFHWFKCIGRFTDIWKSLWYRNSLALCKLSRSMNYNSSRNTAEVLFK